ncbi:disA bacterial checkpoint controller nucleotide-binding domain-containing protein [Ditylenchus destructor]|uniref:DisA bacterial checkpoint controller nucleotide-binding domain-containing protein n=1 Tax=Ditylenchus destructor TaxID=166010 RepID=A0AAD4MGA2_9BILA|nr:disA bacterial checkpoint controller nucleotide-binding domain-containing protein [Ditylenchus destructor]
MLAIKCLPFCVPRPNTPTHGEHFFTNFPDAIFNLRKKRIGGTVIINYRLDSNSTLQSLLIGGTILNESYSAQRMTDIFRNKSVALHDGAMVINHFEETTIYSAGGLFPVDPQHNWQKAAAESAENSNLALLKSRHRSAYSFSHYIRALLVVVSEDHGWVSIFHCGNIALNVTKEELKEKLVNAYNEEINKQKNDCNFSSYEPAINFKHFKTYFAIQFLDYNDPDDIDYFCENMVKCRMQFYGRKFVDLNLGKSADTKLVPYDIARKTILENAIVKLMALRLEQTAKFIVLTYGPKRLGGIFYVLQPNDKTINLLTLSIYTERELFNNNVLAYFLKEQLCQNLYSDYNSIAFHFERSMHGAIVHFVDALNPAIETSDVHIHYKLTVKHKLTTNQGKGQQRPVQSAYRKPAGKKKLTVNRELENVVTPIPKAKLVPSLIEEGCETLLIRLKRKDINERFGFGLNSLYRQIAWLEPNCIAAKQLRVGDKIVAIDGVEACSELQQFMVQLWGKRRFVLDLQISRPINGPDIQQLFERTL